MGSRIAPSLARLVRFGPWLVLVLAGLTGTATGQPEAPSPTEYDVKAAMLFNFARFVEWPASAFDSGQAPIVVGVLGADPFGPTLDGRLRGVTAQGRQLALRRFANAGELRICHILFISSAEARTLPLVLQALENSSVLTVGDTDGFVSRGGIIGFILDGKKVRFQINLDAARKAGLKISSKLLSLATVRGHGQ